MIDAYTAQDVRAAEEPLLAGERGFSGGLMHRAATALAGTARRELRDLRGRVPGGTVVGLVGPGNNGGDTLHALALLAGHGVRTVAVLTSASVHDGGLTALRSAPGSRVVAVVPDAPAEQVWAGDAVAEAFAADVVLDGLLGLGARGGLRDAAAHLVGLLTGLRGETETEAPGRASGGRPPRSRPRVVAVDVPSGVGVDDATVPGPVLAADLTVTFGVPKPCHLLPPADRTVGRLQTVDLGLRPVLDDQGRRAAVRRLEPADVRALWPVPDAAAHKYSRGVVGVVAGTDSYPGAAVLTVAGAQGAGCGMVRYVGPDRVAAAVVAAHPEVVAGTSADVHVQAWVLGPGLVADDAQRDRALDALTEADRSRLPTVVDAGALDLLPERVGPWVVLTPHAGELARLLGSRGVDVPRGEVEAEPLRWAQEAQRRTGATVLLKGATTVVVGPGLVLSQADAPPWLATAGAGDVLAGVLGAVLAGRSELAGQDPGAVARTVAAGVSVHGRAARIARPGGPVTAGEVARAVPDVVAELLR